MNVKLDPVLEAFVADAVADGRYASADEVLRESLRLMQVREAKLKWLRDKIDASLARGGFNTSEEVDAALDATAEELRQQGY